MSLPAWTPFQRTYPDPAQFDTPEAMARFEALAAKDPNRTAEDYREIYRTLMNDEWYANSRYQVAIRRQPNWIAPGIGLVHLSVKTHDRSPIRDWRDMQRIKNELVGPECEGMELYPAESRVVDTANQYHLWVCDSPSFRWPVGWNEGQHKIDGVGVGEEQRPFEEQA